MTGIVTPDDSPKPKVFYLPQGYKNSRRAVAHYGEAESGEISESGTATQYEWWDGRVDATVRPAPIRMRLTQTDGAPLDKNHVAAIHEMGEATREAALSKKVGNQEWMKYAYARLAAAKRRVEEVQ